MLKERAQVVRTSLYAAELIIVSAAYFALYYLTVHFSVIYPLDILPSLKVVKQPASLEMYLKAYWFVLFLWAIILGVRGDYHRLRIQSYFKVIHNILIIGALFFCAFATTAFLMKFDFLSRLVIVAYTVLATLLLLLNRIAVLSIAYYFRRKGYNYRNLLVVGTGRRAQFFIKLVSRHKEWGYRVVGLLDRDPSMKGREIQGYRVLGTLDDLAGLLQDHERVVDEVIFVVPRSWIEEIEKCILACEVLGIPATLSTDFFNLGIASGVPMEMAGRTFLTFEAARLKAGGLFIKRLMDIVISGAALLVLSPVFASVAVAVKLSSPGPVYFRQVRCCRNGRRFTLYKFRSMVSGAEYRIEELRSLNEMGGPVFKMDRDPRLTRIGRYLRRTSLDEIPQFWNVLKGDMSLVGPRPPLPQEVEKYEVWQRRRLSMKPGITCIWQVSGRNQIEFDQWMRMDLRYIDRWSLWLDLKILALTVRAVLTQHGAK